MTLSDIDQFIKSAAAELDGQDSLQTLATLTVMDKIVTGVKKAIKDQLLEEASRYGAKEFTHAGVKLQLKSKKTYKYDHCTAWQQLNDEKNRLEKLMQSTDKEIADVETGEIIPPAQWFASEYIAVILPK